MRAILVVTLLALLSPAAAMAQSQPAPATTPAVAPPPATVAPASKKGGDITRDQYIERAKRAAEKRFDKIDANHDGVLTAEERQAVRAKRAERRAPKPQ
jgi:hypothetical protein